MGKKNNDAPTPPSPQVTADASTSTNIGTGIANAWLNNVNQVTPDGSRTTKQTGSYSYKDPFTGKTYAIPQFTATTSLSPAQKAIKAQSDAAALGLGTLANTQTQRLSGILGTKFDPNAGAPQLQSGINMSGAPGLKSSIDMSGAPALKSSFNTDFSADRQKVEDALMARMQPGLDQSRTALETKLSNQGIKLGSTAYDRGIDESNRSTNDARLGAILGAGQEQSRLAGLDQANAAFGNQARAQFTGEQQSAADLSNQARAQYTGERTNEATFANNARSQALAENYAARSQPLNEISALLAGGQVNQPQFATQNMGQIPTTDVAGLINQNYGQQYQNYQQQQQAQQGLMGGLFGLGAAGIMASDRRVKKHITKRGKVDGHNIYDFRYVDEPASTPRHTGVMAQEVERKMPEAIVQGPGGIKMVDYGKVFPMGRILAEAA